MGSSQQRDLGRAPVTASTIVGVGLRSAFSYLPLTTGSGPCLGGHTHLATPRHLQAGI